MENHDFFNRPQTLSKLFEIGQLIISELDSDRLFDVVVEQTNALIGTERCSIFLIDAEKQVLEPFASKDLRFGFKLEKDKGVAGWVYTHKKALTVNDAYGDPRFAKKADTASGFTTRNILCTPLISRKSECLGTMQVLNKMTGAFVEKDEALLAYIASYVSIAIENSLLYKNVVELNRAKGKAIIHLSHELKTPLALIGSAFDRIDTLTRSLGLEKITPPLARGKRNVRRLLDLQEKVDEIIGQRRKRLVRAGFASMVEDIREYLDQWEENNKETAQEFLLALGQQLDDLFQIRTAHSESIPVDGMLKKIVDDLPLETVGRKLDICVSADPDIHLFINRMQLETICLGLIRNAVENTPDSGYIEIHVIEKADHTLISVSDTGTGITSASQKHIFKGFFHTQDSGAYASKIPFAFNAGGAGLDLLRIKTLADRHGFLLEMESDRCPHIPMDHDQCCGDRSVCSAVNHAEDCERSGGSTFSLLFPHVLFQAGENV